MWQGWAGFMSLGLSPFLSPYLRGPGGATMSTPEARTRDIQTRQIQEAVTNVEKHFGELCQIFAGYVRKTARLRDKGDLLVKEVHAFADTETPSMRQGLKNFADELAKLQDYRQAEVERLEAKIVEPLKSYGAIIRLKREDLKVTLAARNREAKQMAQLERTRQRNPMNRQIITQAESELQRATMDASRISRQLEGAIDNFEKQKYKDIKRIFNDFVTIEMLFHGKALEVYTTAFQNIQNIDDDEDMQVFRSSLHPQDYQSRLDVVRANSRLSYENAPASKCTAVLQQKNKVEETCDDADDEDADDADTTDEE